jgi:hypothetical protein
LALLVLVWALPAGAQALDPGPATPFDDVVAAAERFEAGERRLAGCLLYRAQFRARLLAAVDPAAGAEMGALMGSMMEVVGRPINEWLGGDRDDWIDAMTCAADWARTADDPLVPRAAAPRARARTLAGLEGLIASIPPADELRRQRAANGLANR